jgi:hypothetical protein
MSLDWLNEIHDSTELITSIAFSLQTKANSFWITGNEYMGDLLQTMSDDLLDASKSINQAAGKCITEEYKRSQDMSASIVNAALAGIKLQKEN